MTGARDGYMAMSKKQIHSDADRIFNRTRAKKTRQKLRNAMPLPEVILWSKLRGRQVHDCKFRRQSSILNYILDFYCADLKLAIEIDGESHFVSNAIEADSVRQSLIEQHGIRFLRFTNSEIRHNLDKVLWRIASTCSELGELRRRRISVSGRPIQSHKEYPL
jgi:very-short-patch-repair endonuclease